MMRTCASGVAPALLRGRARVGCWPAARRCSDASSAAPDKPKPAELQPNADLIGVRQAWTARIGQVDFPLAVAVNGDHGRRGRQRRHRGRARCRHRPRALARQRRRAAGRRRRQRRQRWPPWSPRNNELVALSARQGSSGARSSRRLSYTAPFVAGGRVFVLAADRTVSAFDGQTGRRLWTQQRPGEPLVLRQAGVMLAVGDTLVVGLGGRLAGLNPLNGSVALGGPDRHAARHQRRRAPGRPGRQRQPGGRLGLRARLPGQPSAASTRRRGNLLWTKPRQRLARACTATTRWSSAPRPTARWSPGAATTASAPGSTTRCCTAALSAPLALGRSVVVGDSTGCVHMLSREDGTLLNRLATDGSAIAGRARRWPATRWSSSPATAASTASSPQ